MVVIKNGHTYRAETDMIDVTPMSIPNFSWSFTDAQGHEHRWFTKDGHLASGEYRLAESYHIPTAVMVARDTYWCSECGEDHTDSRLECVACGEVIDAGYKTNDRRMFMAGLTHYYIDDERVSKDEFERRLAEGN
jgi:hypothetical protein